MCTIETIRLSMAAVLTLKVITAIFLLVAGFIFSTTDTIVKAYGEYFVEAGAGIVMMGLSSLAISYPFHFAIKRHNRFVLLVLFVIETVLLSQVITVGLTTYESTIPVFPSDLMADCSRHSPESYTLDECNRYLYSDRVSGFRLVWAAFFTEVNNEDNYQLMTQIEDENICCGFGPPLRCFNDTRPFPPDRPLDGVRSNLASQRWKCGLIEFYYPKQENCEDYADPNVLPRILGGCEKDMAAGNCVDEELVDSLSGCSEAIEAYVAGLVGPPALIVMGTSFMNVLVMLICCCMLWKRKEYDVFPDYISNQQEVNPRFANYAKIKDNVVVVPVKDYIYEKGFLPDPNKKRRKKKNEDGETIGEETVTSSKDIENTEPPSRHDGADNISALTK